MAYVELHPEADGRPGAWLEGRPLAPGDPLWVPVDAEAAEIVRGWVPVLFVGVEGEDGPLVVSAVSDEGATFRVSLRVGMRRRHARA
jgi:hypothetical protein